MKPIPTDPMAQHNRLMQAFNDDLLAGDYHAPRAKAVCEISKQTREAALPNKRAASNS
jgi:hypothetical protein